MRRFLLIFFVATGVWLLTGIQSGQAQLTSPQVGWQAELNGMFHNVSGTVTILDEDTVEVDDFTYDGGGISVYLYLGADESHASFVSGLGIGPQLVGTMFDGTQDPLVIDLPEGETLEGYNAISVWCVAVTASFGSGTFQAVSADYDGDGDVDGQDFLLWQRDTSVGSLEDWQQQYGAQAAARANLSAVPEPLSLALALPLAACCFALRPYRRR